MRFVWIMAAAVHQKKHVETEHVRVIMMAVARKRMVHLVDVGISVHKKIAVVVRRALNSVATGSVEKAAKKMKAQTQVILTWSPGTYVLTFCFQ